MKTENLVSGGFGCFALLAWLASFGATLFIVYSLIHFALKYW